ncbi:hypothetical protein COOONC_01543 [Cooperia oncophora]
MEVCLSRVKRGEFHQDILKQRTWLQLRMETNLEVPSLDFTQWYPEDILPSKCWAADGKHFYISLQILTGVL